MRILDVLSSVKLCLKQAWRNNPLTSKETVSFRNYLNRIECDPQSYSEKNKLNKIVVISPSSRK